MQKTKVNINTRINHSGGLILEMHDFSWWVSDLDETPMHTHYQEIVSLVNLLNKYFLTHDANTKETERLIETFK